MVRVNIIKPELLLDQHLLAEWNEIQMLLGTVVQHPNINYQIMPLSYKLGRGHIMFFKNKVSYLMKRLLQLKVELDKRGYSTKSVIEIGDMYLPKIPPMFIRDWQPHSGDESIIKERLLQKHAMQPNWYTYHGRTMSVEEYENFLTGDRRK